METADLQKIFEDFFDYLKLPGFKKYAFYFSLSVYFLGALLIRSLVILFKRLKQRKIRLRSETDLFPSFDEEDVNEYTENFIPTRFQWSTPTRGRELLRILNNPRRLYGIVNINSKTFLIDYLINRVFHYKNISPNRYNTKEPIKKIVLRFLDDFFSDEFSLIADKFNSKRFIMVFADTGMGKTAFMINLYLRYTKKRFRKFRLVLLRFSAHEIDKKINEIADKRNVILLLDGLDEDPKAIENSEARRLELLKQVADFRKVIITCRSQFFFHEELEWKDTSLVKQADKKPYEFGKVFISPFTDEDVEHYIRKKYTYDTNEYNRALEIVRHIPYLKIRPIVLHYIDDFVGGGMTYNSLYDIYNIIVSKWIEREKFNVAEDQKPSFNKNINEFSIGVATFLYFNPESDNIIMPDQIDGIASNYNIPLNSLQLKSKSLLNRGEKNHYKFAHKSFQEFFLSQALYRDKEFRDQFKPQGNDAAFSFFLERCFINHTVKFIKKIALVDDEFDIAHKNFIAGRLQLDHGINVSTVYEILWQDDKLCLEEFAKAISSITIESNEDLKNERIFFPMQSLSLMKIRNCNIEDLNFLRLLNVKNLILQNSTISEFWLNTLKFHFQITVEQRR